ncbi:MULTISPECIES: type 2 lanthipeptide synthetase LanM family protein [Streptomyces]|uniref:Type 2 lanthipeptide synthetase LanM family protein n=1 Tax=Streptomyces doudnae TaxID=3075536 RepID=A0ABD5EU59_9ACTN|nr:MULTISPECIES: type 2 lanthipeptide synthetase LanM family protein [unclassified Streptomyces]MDT0438233.1 type 2 lanthipeptide synthetase LanM family protein [Streptomyces sp. DSM 41981]MYQ65998.1 type 2 lantipeptide synthetase LanM [Streptomyces sp. SID4950]SCE12022.1 type 2 lantibiotic biosynthesis protein LanM [Streptomyces sp. SolWspMP-5a-2]
MRSAINLYPEFDDTEIGETITPLAPFDDHVLAVVAGAPREPAAASARPAVVREWTDRPEEYPFQRVIRAIAAGAADGDPLGAFPGLFADPGDALLELLGRVEIRVRETCTRPLVAAVNHAREQGVLRGQSPEDRYRHFVDEAVRTSFTTAGGLSFPVLRDLTPVVLSSAVDAVVELCARVVADRQALRDTFGIAPDDRLLSFGAPEGDTHHHGRAVCVLTFASGRRLVYKPRDVSCEAAFVRLARELNTAFGTRLVTADALARDGYGYVEHIETEDVSDISERFMRDSGELAAVLYALNARDMHFENILPTRRGPVPVDLETLLHPERVHDGPVPEADGNAYTTIGQSVYGVGILPLVMAGRKKDRGGHVDLGFLGGPGRGTSPFKQMTFDAPFTDRIGLALRPQSVQGRRTVVGERTEEEILRLGREMADGFTRTYRALLAAPDTWRALLRTTAEGLRIRYVHNPTALYSQILRMTTGPSALDDPATYLALLKRVAIASKTSARPLIVSELRQMAERDVPYFTVSATGTRICDGDGTETGAALGHSPLDLALAKASRLGERDLVQQLHLIRSAFTAQFPDNHLAPARDTEPPAAHGRTDTGERAELRSLARELCDNLVETALPDRFAHLPKTWIGPLASAEADRPWPPGVLGYDLYTGRTGIALTLCAAGHVLDDDRALDAARQVFSATAEILASHRYESRSLQQAGYGGYTGMAGILFSLSAAGRLTGADDWVTAAGGAVPLVLDQIRAEPADSLPLDIISGLAGVLNCVTDIVGPDRPDDAVTEIALLLARRVQQDGPFARSVLDQSGFAHGISGVVHALARAHPLLPAEHANEVRGVLDALVARLDRFFDPEQRNWASRASADGTFATGWCHGSTSIALALSAYADLPGGADVTALRDQAVDNTLRLGFGRNLTWCHGDLGNHAALRHIAGPGDTPLHTEVRAQERRWLTPEVLRRKTADPDSRYAHTNSLMVGSAGLALHLLGRLDPELRLCPLTLTTGGR